MNSALGFSHHRMRLGCHSLSYASLTLLMQLHKPCALACQTSLEAVLTYASWVWSLWVHTSAENWQSIGSLGLSPSQAPKSFSPPTTLGGEGEQLAWELPRLVNDSWMFPFLCRILSWPVKAKFHCFKPPGWKEGMSPCVCLSIHSCCFLSASFN